MKDRHATLRAVPMFQTCNDKELGRIGKLAEQLSAAAGEVMTAEGKTGNEFYVLVSGKATVSRAGKQIATLGPGDFFGELALLDPHPRTATVTMATDGELLEVTQREFWTLVDDIPGLARKLLQGLARRMHTMEA
jgi:CRP/FNR family cyclic AMP-dependent transcriptional regulator